MADQKKQKMMLVLLGVLVLGAGSAFYFMRADSGSSTKSTFSTQTGRRVRKQKAKTKQATTRRVREAKPAAKRATTGRRRRRATQRDTSTRRRQRSGGRRTKLKKQKVHPAG